MSKICPEVIFMFLSKNCTSFSKGNADSLNCLVDHGFFRHLADFITSLYGIIPQSIDFRSAEVLCKTGFRCIRTTLIEDSQKTVNLPNQGRMDVKEEKIQKARALLHNTICQIENRSLSCSLTFGI
jgi:hypothetical protein